MAKLDLNSIACKYTVSAGSVNWKAMKEEEKGKITPTKFTNTLCISRHWLCGLHKNSRSSSSCSGNQREIRKQRLVQIWSRRAEKIPETEAQCCQNAERYMTKFQTASTKSWKKPTHEWKIKLIRQKQNTKLARQTQFTKGI